LPDGKTFTFKLNSEAVAVFVFLNLKTRPHGYFSDNGFIHIEGVKTMTYVSRDVLTLTEFLADLEVMSLFDVTQVA